MSDIDDDTRVCPSCEEERPAAAFRSAHPRTHCDECHAVKLRPTLSADEVDPGPGEPALSGTGVRTEETSEGAPRAHKVASSAEGAGDLNPDLLETARIERCTRSRIPVTCPVFGIALDIGLDPVHGAKKHRGAWMSLLAARALAGGISAEQLEHAAAWLRERDEESA